MAQKKAEMDSMYKHLEKEAIDFVLEWFDLNHYLVDPDSLYLVWMGLTKSGYRCMIGSTDFPNNYFEIKVNKKTGETICTCLRRFEYIVKLPDSNEIKRFIA